MSQTSTEELCVITLKNDAKFKEKLAYAFKIDLRILTSFDPMLESFKNKYFNGFFLINVFNVSSKKVQRNHALLY